MIVLGLHHPSWLFQPSYSNVPSAMNNRRDLRQQRDRPKKDPTFWVGALVIVVVLASIGVVLYNALTEKHAYDAEHASGSASASGTSPAGASQ